MLVIGLTTLFLLAGSPPAGGAEQFSPVYTSGVASGLQYGVAAVQGRRPYMEDMHQVADFDDEPAAANVGMTHFFAVFDGHGGKRAAAWAHAHLVQNLLQELKSGGGARHGGGDADGNAENSSSTPSATALDAAAVDAFHRTDAAFLKQAALRRIPDGSTAVTCMVQTVGGGGGGSSSESSNGADAAAAAANGGGGGGGGGAAKAERRLLVANLGDSRCVMVRSDGTALPLSSDHKPNRPDERLRVQAAGGQVIYAGCWRVQGDLAVSRAFGDAHLKAYGVSSTPELSELRLTSRDAYLVLASDGLWDVVDEQQCASSVLRAADPLAAARALCDLASTRGSMDNITVLVVALWP